MILCSYNHCRAYSVGPIRLRRLLSLNAHDFSSSIRVPLFFIAPLVLLPHENPIPELSSILGLQPHTRSLRTSTFPYFASCVRLRPLLLRPCTSRQLQSWALGRAFFQSLLQIPSYSRISVSVQSDNLMQEYRGATYFVHPQMRWNRGRGCRGTADFLVSKRMCAPYSCAPQC